MQPDCPPTRFATYPRALSLLVLIALVTATAWCLYVALSPVEPADGTPPDGSDLLLYQRIIERVHSGESYYNAAGSELRAAGYATGSPFNWRSPTYAWFIGSLPTPAWGQLILVVCSIATAIMAYTVVLREGGPWKAVGLLLPLLGALIWCIDGPPPAFLSQELWAGTLIALSVCAYATTRWRLGVAAGLAALFYRELALPYCLISLFLAWRQKRHREVAIWLAGLAVYGVFLTYHILEVSHRITEADRVPTSWIQFGGTGFLLTTCRMNSFLFRLPSWVTALYLPLSLFGLVGWRGWTAARVGLTVVAYLTAFAVVGQPFNDYWGLLYAALLPFGLVWAPASLRDLYVAIRTS